MKYLTTFIVCILLTGCSNLYRSVVTVTEVRHAVMNELGAEFRAGRMSTETWLKVEQADLQYRTAAAAAEQSLVTYKATGQGNTADAIRVVKVSVSTLIELLAGFQSTAAHTKNLRKATDL